MNTLWNVTQEIADEVSVVSYQTLIGDGKSLKGKISGEAFEIYYSGAHTYHYWMCDDGGVASVSVTRKDYVEWLNNHKKIKDAIKAGNKVAGIPLNI